MRPAESVPYLHPLPEIEDELCALLQETDETPDIPLNSELHETKISGATVRYNIFKAIDESLIRDPRPVIIENGLCASDEAYRTLAEEMAKRGYIVITKEPPRHQNPFVAYRPHNFLRPMELQAKATWGVMRDYMQKQPPEDPEAVQQFHLVGHSMGAPVGSDVAEHHPEHVASLTLIGGAGLTKHRTPGMAGKLWSVTTQEIVPAFFLPGRIANADLAVASLKHILSNLNRLGREAIQVSNHYTIPSLQRLQSHPMQRFNIQPLNDHFFPYRRQLGAAALFDRFICFNVGRADHLAPQTQAALVAAVITNLLETPVRQLPVAA